MKIKTNWQTNSSGEARSNYITIDGTIKRIVAKHSDANYTGFYDITLLDRFGVDILNGRGLYCYDNRTIDRVIYASYPTRKNYPKTYGRHTIVVSSDTTTTDGEIEIEIGELSAELRNFEGNEQEHIYISNPILTTEQVICFPYGRCQMVTMTAQTDIGTVTFQLEARSRFTPGTTGTLLLDSSAVADSTGITVSQFVAEIPHNNWIVLQCSATSGVPTTLHIQIEYILV